MSADDRIELRIAKWKDRFFAWVIDFVIIWATVLVIHSVLAFVFWHNGPDYMMLVADFEHYPRTWGAHGFFFGVGTSFVFFAYWTILEFRKGQSLGKRILGIKTVKTDGTPGSFGQSALNSFGKSFLFTADVILGLIFTRKKRQRLFNRLSSTIVIKLQDDKEPNISYKMD
jgi:uncharacterized RDD family membrane protein YckC